MSCCELCVTFDFGPAKIFSSITFDTYFSYHKVVWIAGTDYVLLSNCTVSIDTYTSFNKLIK